MLTIEIQELKMDCPGRFHFPKSGQVTLMHKESPPGDSPENLVVKSHDRAVRNHPRGKSSRTWAPGCAAICS